MAVPLAAEIVRAMGGMVDLCNTGAGWQINLTLKKAQDSGIEKEPE